MASTNTVVCDRCGLPIQNVGQFGSTQFAIGSLAEAIRANPAPIKKAVAFPGSLLDLCSTCVMDVAAYVVQKPESQLAPPAK